MSNNQTINFPGSVGLQQRVLPAYRSTFFDALAAACENGLSVFAGQPRPAEAITTVDHLQEARYIPARNHHLGRVNSPFYICLQSGLLSWLIEWQPDVLIAEANPRYLTTRLGVNWMHAKGRPVLGWGLGVPPAGGSLERAREPGRQRFLSMFDGLIAYSQRGAEEYRAQGFPAERVFVAPNVVASPPEEPPLERSPAFVDRPVILFVGRLQARKRIDNLLHACTTLPTQLQPHLLIVGDGPERGEFQALAEAIYPQTEFPGTLQGPELVTYFRKADLFVLPGTGGLAVQQAMAHALPVIVAEGDGTQDDFVHPENGWRIPPDDLDALTETLREALTDATRLRRMGMESYRIVRDEVNIQVMVGVFIRAINQVSLLENE